MVPTLLPGDRVVAVRSRVRVGDVVALRDPRDQRRVMVKRITCLTADGRAEVAGDNADASTDSRHFGPVDPSLVLGRVVYRYAPADRVGRISRGGGGAPPRH
jgi:nickel-type superoxide dismutase maturation protease